MNQALKGIIITIAIITLATLIGCMAAVSLIPSLAMVGVSATGEAIRSGMKDLNITESPGFTFTDLKNKKFGIFVASQSQMAMGLSGAEANLYSDMIANEFIKKGFDTRVVSENVDPNDATKLNALADKQMDVFIKCNLSMGMMPVSSFGILTGAGVGDVRTGVSEFAIKGVDIKTGKILFLVTGSYSKTKTTSDFASDIAIILNEKVAPPPQSEDSKKKNNTAAQ